MIKYLKDQKSQRSLFEGVLLVYLSLSLSLSMSDIVTYWAVQTVSGQLIRRHHILVSTQNHFCRSVGITHILDIYQSFELKIISRGMHDILCKMNLNFDSESSIYLCIITNSFTKTSGPSGFTASISFICRIWCPTLRPLAVPFLIHTRVAKCQGCNGYIRVKNWPVRVKSLGGPKN